MSTKTAAGAAAVPAQKTKHPKWSRFVWHVKQNKYLYLMILPAVIWYLIFMYAPMYGAQIAFKDFVSFKGIHGSEWVGFKHFISFFQSPNFGRLIKNTLGISLYSIVVGFPVPVILALLLNEVRNKKFQKGVQTIVYLPHFISMVVLVSIVSAFLSPSSGMLNSIIEFFGGDPIYFMAEPGYFKTIYVISDIWQNAGYNSIVYLAALTSIDPALYEAATVDGASKWDKLIRITLPSIMPTVMTMLILRMGSMFSVGYEKIMLMYNDATLETADVISTYVYRRAFESGDYSFSTAVGLFNSVINFVILISFNKISKKVSEVSLW